MEKENGGERKTAMRENERRRPMQKGREGKAERKGEIKEERESETATEAEADRIIVL